MAARLAQQQLEQQRRAGPEWRDALSGRQFHLGRLGKRERDQRHDLPERHAQQHQYDADAGCGERFVGDSGRRQYYGGTIVTANGASLVVTGSGTLDGVTVNGVLDVGNSYSAAELTVTNGLVLEWDGAGGQPDQQ